jgi:putative DNA primase/helicase
LHLCEGLESALSAMMRNFCPMWAVGSTAQLAEFPVLAGVEFLTVIADHDEPGLKAARQVRQRWVHAGRGAVTKISRNQGEDANDVIQRRARE